jgi:uncharacterized membrane protein
MGALHPQVVHFTIVLAIVGVASRLVSLLGKPAFASPAATTLLPLAAVSSVEALGQKDAAAEALEAVVKTFPNPQQRVEALRRSR